ncbi:hypothetical protein QWY93_19485 [Echinicola jeungdonensis]|uniref:hypothetical protein n=1 Tax=Echinicola jeungdonensis TaxID=709343 RepID=UPI0025B3A94B|nr:hypothetical protein [Echinicola jeungdonensis]MDN3671437.1 hypothetical protein [Echinicola jeungdonensis]
MKGLVIFLTASISLFILACSEIEEEAAYVGVPKFLWVLMNRGIWLMNGLVKVVPKTVNQFLPFLIQVALWKGLQPV